MNELQIVVNQQPGTILTNFSEIRKSLSAQMEVYKELEVTEGNKPERKKDIAVLRKMLKAVTEKESEVRNKCLEPYEEFRRQSNELKEIINEPIGILDNQVKEFEEWQRLQKQEDIKAAFNAIIAGYPELIDEIGIIVIYDNRWENATASMKSIKDEMTAKLDKIRNEVILIKSMVSDKTEEALNLFWGDLDITKAVTMINRYEAQKREIQARLEEQQRRDREAELERERQRVRDEEHKRIQAEERIREEERLKAEEAAARIREEAAAKEEWIREEERLATEKKLLGIKEQAPAGPVDLEAPFDADELPFVVPGDISVKAVFTVIGNPFELQQVEMYLNSIGVDFRREDVQ